MKYTFDFGWLLDYYPQIAKGIAVTLELIAIGGVLGIALGIVCAWVRALGAKWLRPPVATYVELIRNTPFLIQLFFIFFGLPSLGLQLSELTAANIAMVVNLGAYSCEIIRAGIQATPKGQFEAGASLAMTRFETFRHVVLVPSLQRIWPALSSQVVIVMLGSSEDNAFGKLVSRPAELGGTTASPYIATDDIDARCERARKAGAEICMEPHDQPYGSRDFICKDPEGHVWCFGTYRPSAEPA